MPSVAAVFRVQDRAARADHETVQLVGKVYAEEIDVCVHHGRLRPRQSAVCGAQDGRARADRPAVRFISEEDAREPRIGRRLAHSPTLAARCGREHAALRADGPTAR